MEKIFPQRCLIVLDNVLQLLDSKKNKKFLPLSLIFYKFIFYMGAHQAIQRYKPRREERECEHILGVLETNMEIHK